MVKLGTSARPILIRVQTERRGGELAEICDRNNWKFICEIEPDYPEDISELEYMLNPKRFKGKVPKLKSSYSTPVIKTEPTIGRNDFCRK